MSFRVGDRVVIDYEGHTVDGEIMLTSKNGRSLVLTFDTVLGSYVGSMPVLTDPARDVAEYQYRDLIHDMPVSIRPREATHQEPSST
jgi:hypothetical protein